MSNPYQPPSFDPKYFADAPLAPQPASGFGWVSQVRVVAILNIVQGALELPMGLVLVGAAIVMPYFFASEKAAGRSEMPAEVEWVLPVVYSTIGIPILLSGCLRIYAGIQNFRFRGRILGIVSFALGLVSMMGCYCAPTSIAVLVYGLVVYLNPAVVAAFEMGKQGNPGNSILASFAMDRHPSPPPSQ